MFGKNCTLATWAAAGACGVMLAAASAEAAGWGSLKGRFVYEGQDEGGDVKVTKDVEFCSKTPLADETVEVGDGSGLRNLFVYLYVKRGAKVEVHPDYAAAEATPLTLDNKACRFEPHAMTLWTKHPLEIRNSDGGIGHNTNAQKLVANPKFNEQISNDRPTVKKFEKSEPLPTEVACNVHPWMTAILLIRDNPYMAVSGADGSFEIKNVPAGKQEFVLWHEAKGFVRDVKLKTSATDRKGQVELTIPEGGVLDLGDIKVAPAMLGL